MLVSKEYYIINFLFVCTAFFLFTFLIIIFGFFFFYYLKKNNKQDWKLNNIETFLLSFAIGISVYICFCFILDIFEFYNFFTGYFSIIIFDFIFILYLYYNGIINREKILHFKNSIEKELSENIKIIVSLILILVIIISLQIWYQWIIITKEYSIPSRDTYVWLGDVWYLLKEEKLLREHLPIQYPRGYTFYLAAPELIYPNFQFSYFYLKFIGIPFFSFYIFVIAMVIYRIFKKNYMVFIGLSLVLTSNYLFSRFISFTSSAICTLLIIISLVILYSKCPFYLISFIIVALFFFNSLYAFFYVFILFFLIIIQLIYSNLTLKVFLIKYLFKTLLLLILMLIPWILHIVFVQNLNIYDFIEYFNENIISVISNETVLINSKSSELFLLQIRYLLEDLLPKNDLVSAFFDIVKRILSLFFIFALFSLFVPMKYFYTKKKFWNIINFGKMSVIAIIGLYLMEIYFIGVQNVFFENSDWFKMRAIEGFAGPIIILVCFLFMTLIKKAEVLTAYLANHFYKYKNLIERNKFSVLFRVDELLIVLLIISIIGASFADRRIYYSYYFEQDQIETIFYIKQHIPDNSKILVSDFGNGPNCLYELLNTYDVYKWDFEFSENSFNETLDYIQDKGIEYILLDYTMINSTEKSYFNDYPHFEIMYENDYNIVFEVDI